MELPVIRCVIFFVWKDVHTRRQAPVKIPTEIRMDLSFLRIGIYRPFFEHASTLVVQECHRFLGRLVAAGAQLVDVQIPFLEEARLAHIICFGSEERSTLNILHKEKVGRLSASTRFQLSVLGQLQSMDYIQANRVRTATMEAMRTVFQTVDVVVTPTTGCMALPLDEAYLAHGNTNLARTADTIRFSFLANLTGGSALSDDR